MFLAVTLDVSGNIKVRAFLVAITFVVTTARLYEFSRKNVNKYLESGRDMVNVESANRWHKLCYMLYVILSALCTQYRHIFHYLAINVVKSNTRGALAYQYYRVIL